LRKIFSNGNNAFNFWITKRTAAGAAEAEAATTTGSRSILVKGKTQLNLAFALNLN